jgi:hypothetical protein
MTERRFVLVDFRYTDDAVGHIRLYEAGNTYDMPRALAHAARAAASGLTIWASPARLKILIKKLRRSLLSVGGGLSLSGLSTSRGTVLRSRCSAHLAGAPIARRGIGLASGKSPPE